MKPWIRKPHIRAGIWTKWVCIGRTVSCIPVCGGGATPREAYDRMAQRLLTWLP